MLHGEEMKGLIYFARPTKAVRLNAGRGGGAKYGQFPALIWFEAEGRMNLHIWDRATGQEARLGSEVAG
jgi:hypothetical protein